MAIQSLQQIMAQMGIQPQQEPTACNQRQNLSRVSTQSFKPNPTRSSWVGCPEKLFMERMNPQAQLSVCTDDDRCFFGDFPTLLGLEKQYQKATPISWLVAQLLDLSEFCGCKNKLDDYQLRQCAFLIYREYGYMKTSELMLFFVRLKSGHYGEFYGAVDAIRIMAALRKFKQERGDAYFHHDSELAQQRITEGKRGAITWEAYCDITGVHKPSQPGVLQAAVAM